MVIRRRLLPVAITLLMVLGFLRWLGQDQGLYGNKAGVLALTLSAIAVISVLLWCFARWLDRNEATQRGLQRELQRGSRHFELSRDLTVTSSADGYFTSVNPAVTSILGWSVEEFLTRPFLDMVHPDDHAATLAEVSKLGEGQVTFNFVNRYLRRDGSYCWLDWNAVVPPDEDLMYASARDITQRKAIEAALEASERQTRQILETAHDAFISIDARGLITDWNPHAETIFGWSRHEVLGHELSTTIIPDGQREAHRKGMQRCLDTGEMRLLGKPLELSALHRDGREFPIELTITPLETENGVVFNAFLRDITQRKKAQEELARARDQAVEASRIKSMFVANVSHEIRTPMNGVIGMTALLLDTDLDDEQHEYAETISSSGEALLEIIDDILDFSKIEAGKLEVDPADFDLREAIERACGILAARAHQKGLEFVVAIDPDVPALVHGDAARLRQVVVNLVSNAIKFTAVGEIVVRVSSIPAPRGASLVRLDVSDTGIGIASHVLQQLFKPYIQADGSTTRKYGGTGLGLAISRQVIELMGGTVGAESEPGKGSCFWFELPLAGAAVSDDSSEEEREIAGLRVLVVDDNATSRRFLRRQLKSWQMSCQVADSAAHALELLESAARSGMPYALAMLDVNMPDVGGIDLARAIRDRPALRDIRLILLIPSGVRTAPPEDTAVNGLLSKPVRESRLYEEIQAAMAGDRPVVPSAHRVPSADPGARHGGATPDILVVEDTLVNQAVAVRMLEKCGFAAHLAGNGRKALEAMSERAYAAVLMDCQMPELDGYDTTREIRRREEGGPRIPIIAMTAHAMKGERERCLAAGMDDYLTKPLRKQTLKDVLARWVPAADTAADTIPLKAPHVVAGARAGLLHEGVIAEIENLGGDMLADLVSLYFDDSTECVSELSAAIGQGEMVAIGQAAHKLKGSSGTLGAAHVSSLAAEFEAVARAGDLSGADDLLDRLRSGLAATQLALRARIPEPRPPS